MLVQYKSYRKKLITFENKCLRKIMNIRLYAFKTNKEIREMSKQPYITTFIRSRRWGYCGHALRMNDTEIPKQLTKWNTTRKRKRGTPKETLRRTLEREVKVTGLQCRQSHADAAADRISWKKMVSILCISLDADGQ